MTGSPRRRRLLLLAKDNPELARRLAFHLQWATDRQIPIRDLVADARRAAGEGLARLGPPGDPVSP